MPCRGEWNDDVLEEKTRGDVDADVVCREKFMLIKSTLRRRGKYYSEVAFHLNFEVFRAEKDLWVEMILSSFISESYCFEEDSSVCDVMKMFVIQFFVDEAQKDENSMKL